MKTIILLLSTLTAFCAPAPRGVRLTWEANPAEQFITSYHLYLSLAPSNTAPATNWVVPGHMTNLALYFANREIRPQDATNDAVLVQRFHYTSTNYPPRMWFSATASNIYGESGFSEDAPLGLPPLPAQGIRIQEFYSSTEYIEVTWPDLPQWSQIQTSDDLVGWTNVVSIQFSYSAMQTERPFNLTFSHYVTNAPAKFWRKINLIED